MPVMSGVDATAKLRASGYTKPIVALTANALKEDREKCHRAGVDEYLTKPVDLDQFNGVLKRFLKPKNPQPVKTQSPNTSTAMMDLADDPEYQALIRQFEEELPSKLKQIQSSAAQQDWVELKNQVHKLKGLGASFGYPKLSEISAQIQTNIAQGLFDKIPNLVEQLADGGQQCYQQNKLSSNF